MINEKTIQDIIAAEEERERWMDSGCSYEDYSENYEDYWEMSEC